MHLTAPFPNSFAGIHQCIHRIAVSEKMAGSICDISGPLHSLFNQKRLHSSLGYCPLVEFERLQSSGPMLVAP